MILVDSKKFEEYFKILTLNLSVEGRIENQKRGINNINLEEMFDFVLFKLKQYVKKNKIRQALTGMDKLKFIDSYFINYNNCLYMINDVDSYTLGFSKVSLIDPYKNTIMVADSTTHVEMYNVYEEFNEDEKTNLDDIINYLKIIDINSSMFLFKTSIKQLVEQGFKKEDIVEALNNLFYENEIGEENTKTPKK